VVLSSCRLFGGEACVLPALSCAAACSTSIGVIEPNGDWNHRMEACYEQYGSEESLKIRVL